MTKEKFDPIKSQNDDERSEFWNTFSKGFIPIINARSTKSYLKGEIDLCEKFLQSPNGKSGKFLKLDLWNEAHHTEILKYIHKNYDEVYGIDISEHVVEQANKNLKKNNISATTVVCDLRKMPFESNTFDYLYTMGTIEHLPEPIAGMKEISRVLAKGGKAVIGVPNKYEWFGKSIALDLFAYLGIKGDGYEFSFGWKQLEKELNECGLRLIEKDGPYFMPWPIRAADWFLSQKFPKLCFLFYPFIYISEFFSRFNFFRRNGSLIAAVVIKD
jgi:SAM-dependent methyltransferase